MLASIGSIIKKEAIDMNKMAVDPNFTLHFSKRVSSFEDAASTFRKAIGTVHRLGHSLLGNEPKFFDKPQVVDSEPGTIVVANLTEEELGKYKERLLYIYGSIWGILNQREYEASEPFVDNFMDGVDVNEEDLDKFREILLRAHQRVRKFKTREGLEDFVMYLRNMVYIAEDSYRPMIRSDEEVPFYFEPALRLAWITIEEAKDGGYLVEGGSDFVKCPNGVSSELRSSGYGFETEITRLTGMHFRRQG